LLECAFVLEALAPTRLHLDQFLPPTLIRIVVDHQGKVYGGALPSAVLAAGDSRRLVGQEAFRRNLFPKMLEAANALAATAAEAPAESARKHAEECLGAELARLEDLATRNTQVSQAEIDGLRSLRTETLESLGAPRLRLDALRLVWRT
jgi:ATP-dependent helicase HepA